MPILLLHGREVHSVFELLGTRENDVTFSLGWVLSRCGRFLEALLETLFPSGAPLPDEISVRLQSFAADGGYTDIEIEGAGLHVIVEAKRGWALPTHEQLRRYAGRIRSETQRRCLLVLAECSHEYAEPRLGQMINGIPIIYRSWQVTANLAHQAAILTSSYGEKQLLREFGTYMSKAIRAQDRTSNMVYVLALAEGTPQFSTISWIDIVEKAGHYFHPFGKGWPAEPPNYLAFRYRGRLQSIHHVERAEVMDDVHTEMLEIAPGALRDHMLYWLGPAITTAHEVRTGKRINYAARRWAAIDLLLTCSTISDACDLTRARLAEVV